MGKTRQETTSQGTQTVTPQPTAEERELNKLYLEREKFLDPQIRSTQSQGLDLVSRLLGGQQLPGYLQGLPGGISPQVTQDIVNQSLKDMNTQLAYSGAGTFLESGASQAIGTRAASDIRTQSEQFNLQNLLQLLNLGVGGQAQVQQPILGFGSLLSSRLAGLRPVTSTSTGFQSSLQRNPFITGDSLVQGAGMAIGTKAAFACIPEGEEIDTPDGPKKIEDLKAGDLVIDYYGGVAKIKMKYEFDEGHSHNRFIKMTLEDGETITLCDYHRVVDIYLKDLEIDGVTKEFVEYEGRSFDLLTDSINGGYRMKGISVNSMIPELHKMTALMNGDFNAAI